jgi:DnaJ domain
MQFGLSTRRKLITLLGGAAVALLEIAFVVALQGVALLGMIVVIVIVIITDLVVLGHAFSLSGLDGRREQALVLTVNIMVIVILIWSFRQRGKLRQAEQHHAKDHRQQRERAAKSYEEDKWWTEQRERAANEEDKWWTVLEVSPDASASDIRRSYLCKIQQYHPDRVAGLAPEVRELAERRSRTLNAAYAEAMRERRVKLVR